MCLSPISIPIRSKLHSYGNMDVPCGECVQCLQGKQNIWITRLYYHLKSCKSAHFVTLTYNNDNLPKVINEETGEELSSLCKQHVTLWLKRNRISFKRKYGYNSKYTYFLCGEYGYNFRRPHYHILFFDIELHLLDTMLQEWNQMFGFTLSKLVDLSTHKSLYNSAKYLSKYSLKGIFDDYRIIKLPNPEAKFDVSQPKYIKLMPIVQLPFRQMSKGIGISYLDNKMINYHLASDFESDDYETFIQQIYERKKIFIPQDNGKILSFPLPRYYSEKIYGKSDFLKDAILSHYVTFHKQLRCEKLSQLCGKERVEEKGCILRDAEIKHKQFLERDITTKLKQWYSKSKF